MPQSVGKKKGHAIPLPAKGQEEAFKRANPWMNPGRPLFRVGCVPLEVQTSG